MIKRAILQHLFLIFVFFSLGATRLSASESIEISTIEYPSLFQSIAQPGLGHGAAQDITTAAFKTANIIPSYAYQPMIRAVDSVISKRYPANLGSINWFIKDGKEGDVETVDLMYINFSLFYIRSRFPDPREWPTFEQLKNFQIGNVRGSSTTPVVDSLGIKPEWVSSLELNLRKLSAGRLDFAIAGEKAGWTLINQLYLQPEKFATLPDPIHVVPISLVFHRDQKELKQRFEQGLCHIIANGTYLEIMQRYYTDPSNLANAQLRKLPPYCEHS